MGVNKQRPKEKQKELPFAEELGGTNADKDQPASRRIALNRARTDQSRARCWTDRLRTDDSAKGAHPTPPSPRERE